MIRMAMDRVCGLGVGGWGLGVGGWGLGVGGWGLGFGVPGSGFRVSNLENLVHDLLLRVHLHHPARQSAGRGVVLGLDRLGHGLPVEGLGFAV